MLFNQFIWNNYKETTEGKRAIKIFESLSAKTIFKSYGKNGDFTTRFMSDYVDKLEKYNQTIKFPTRINDTIIRNLFDRICDKGLVILDDAGDQEILDIKERRLHYRIRMWSTWLYTKYPKYFKPYFFSNKIDALHQIADAFNIELPPVPSKFKYKERLYFYIDVCKAFGRFQETYSLNDSEFCAFLYDFAPKALGNHQTYTDMPAATQVWLVGANEAGYDFEYVDKATWETESFWQGNLDTRRGDIIMMYCKTPRSYVHSIWRANSNGYADPFYYYYSNIYITNPVKVEPITSIEFKNDPILSQIPVVRSNFQGISGSTVSSSQYEHYLKILESKGFDISILPRLYKHVTYNHTLNNEREVELDLIEPLLLKLGYQENDWIRQLPVKMGRGESYYPDYVFLSNQMKGFEKAELLVESKYYIKNNKELENAFLQTLSYARRLGANKFVLADKDALWVFTEEKGGFNRNEFKKIYWSELENADVFRSLMKQIGKKN